MEDLHAVTVHQSLDDLAEQVDSLAFGKRASLGKKVEELSAVDILHNEVDLVFVLPHIVETDDVGVPQKPHDDYLPLEGYGERLAVLRLLGLQALGEIGQAARADPVCSALLDDLGNGDVAGASVPHK